MGSARPEGNGSEECASAKEGDMTATACRAAGEGVEVLGDSGGADWNPTSSRPAATTGTLGSL